MKEIIVLKKHELYKLLDCLLPMITDEDLEKEIKEGRKLILFGKERKVEKVPENWEELKELCEEFGEIEILENNIYFRGMTFRLNGDVEDFEGNIIGENRTPQQMWQIIKSLIDKNWRANK